MNANRYFFGLLLLFCAAIGAIGAPQKDAAGKANSAPTRSTQLLMRDKLEYANKILEGLSTADFKKIGEGANMLSLVSRAASWHLAGDAEYNRRRKDFEHIAKSMEMHAEQKNLDAAALDYVELTMACVQCHKQVRALRSAK